MPYKWEGGVARAERCASSRSPSPRFVTAPLPFEPVLRRIGAEASRVGLEAHVVGGAVRDALLGRETTDLDVVAVGPGSGVALARAVSR